METIQNIKGQMEVYHATQAAALMEAERYVKAKGYLITYPDNLWVEHIPYGQTQKYDFPLIVERTGNEAKFWAHIQLYRMGSGKYELNCYLS